MAKGKKGSDSFDRMTNFNEYESGMASITNELGQQDIMYQKIAKNMDISKGIINSIAATLKKNNDLTDSQKDTIEKSVEAYKDQSVAIAKAAIALKKKKITQEEYNDLVIKGNEAYQDLTKSIAESGKSIKSILPTLKAMGTSMNSFGEAAKRSQQVLDGMNTALDQIGSSGVEGMRELGDVIKSASQGGKGLTTALFALGAAAGAAAYNYGLLGDKVGTVAGYDKEIARISGEINVINQEIERGGFGGRNFVNEKAMVQFAASMRQAAASFQAASKTALFGDKLGGVGYAAGQLQTAGIGAENIASAMSSAADATGRMPTGKVGADMAIMAARTGASAESIASITDSFMRMDGLSETTALNMQEGLRNMAKQANINLNGLMEEMASASKEMLGYQIKSTSVLARQVTYAKSLGVSFQDVAKAGQSMVLNYKDSIKSEMQLSAMLGKNVDLSEVRAKFASGDTEGAMKALKSQGLNPADMDMFQQQQLSSALGGMDLTTLQKISTKTGTTGNLAEGNATAGNKSFLNRTVAAQATLEATNASISADTAIQLSKLDSQLEQAKQKALQDNTGGIATLTEQMKQQEFLKNAMTGLTTALIGLASGGLTSLLGNGVKSLFSKGAPKVPGISTPSIPQPSGPLTKKGLPDMRYKANKIPGGGMVDDVAKVAGKGGGIMGKLGKAGKFGAKLLGKAALPLAIASAAYDGFQGYNKAGENLGIKGREATTGEKLSSAGGSILSGLSFGLLDEKSMSKGIAKLFGAGPDAAKPAAKPGNTSVASPSADMNKILERVATSTNNTVIDLNNLYKKTSEVGNNVITNGNTQIRQMDGLMTNGNTQIAELRILNTNTLALVNLTKTIEALTVATYEGKGNVAVSIDGKNIAYAFDRYKENTRGGDPNSKTK